MKPMKAGDSLVDHARPMIDVMTELTQALKEFANFKKENPDFATVKADHQALKEHVATIEENGVPS